MNFVEELKWRGMVHNMMPGTEELLEKEVVTAYLGFDPTADSLHIGHLCGVMMLRHFLSACSVTEQLFITHTSAPEHDSMRSNPPSSNMRARVELSEKFILQPSVWKLTRRLSINRDFVFLHIN